MSRNIITRCMITALMLVFMTAGMAFAGVGGSDVPTVPGLIEVGQTGVEMSFTITNQSTDPNDVNDVEALVGLVYFTTTCGSSLTPGIPCPPALREAPNTISINPLTAAGVSGGCIGDTFTVAETLIPNEYVFTPDSGSLILGPSVPGGDPAKCEIEFTADVNALPVNDSSGNTGLQTSQLARVASDVGEGGLRDVITLERGAAAGSSTLRVLESCLHVEKVCTDPLVCEGDISVEVTATNCGEVDLTDLAVTDDLAGSLTCAQTVLVPGGSTTCTGSHTDVPGTYEDTITASAISSLSLEPVSPDDTSILSDTCDIVPCPTVALMKECENADSCTATGIDFDITVSNTGPVTLSQCTVTDPDCLGAPVNTGPIAPGDPPVQLTCNIAGSQGDTISNSASVECISVFGDPTTANAGPAECSIPLCPIVGLTKVCENADSCLATGIDFDITVSNTGPVMLAECTVTDPDCLGAPVNTGPIAPGDPPVQLTCNIAGSQGDTISNSASVSCLAANGDSTTANAGPAECSIPLCGTVGLTKVCENADSCTATGIDFDITVSNTGPVTLSQCTVTDPDCLGAPVNTGPIAPGDPPVSLTCNIAGSEGDTISNSASVSCSDVNGGTTTANAGPAECSIPLCGTVGLTKVCENADSCLATGIDFDITVSNTGTVTLDQCTVTDPDCLGAPVNTGPIAPGDPPVQLTCNIAGSEGDTISNSASVSCSDVNGGTTTANAGPAECSIPLCGTVGLTKVCENADSCTATGIDFDITVSNTGPVTLSQCTVTDPDCLGAPVNTGPIAPGDPPVSLTCNIAGSAGDTISNSASVSCSDVNGGTTTANAGPVECSIPPEPTVELTKTCDTGDLESCAVEDFQFTITVTNGAVPVDSAILNDAECGITDMEIGPLAANQVVTQTCVISASAAAGTTVDVSNSASVTVIDGDPADECVAEANDAAECSITCPELFGGCRMTGGEIYSIDDTKYTTGGQIGAPSESGCGGPPKGKCVEGFCEGGNNPGGLCMSNEDCPHSTGSNSLYPWGDWEHNHHNGPDDGYITGGSFAFHSGTAAAPREAFISNIMCADPGWCVQARPAPFKQIYWEGTGVFHNMKNKGTDLAMPDFDDCDVVTYNKKDKGTIHYYRAHVGDFGESTGPGRRQAPVEGCSNYPEGFDNDWTVAECNAVANVTEISDKPTNFDKSELHPYCEAQTCALTEPNTGCPDWYDITIHCTDSPDSHVIYKVTNWIEQGNYQLHPPVGDSCNFSCGDGVCESTQFGDEVDTCPEDCI